MTVLDGGELLARTLRQAGVEEIFALHGGHLESSYQGRVNNHIRLTDTRHEAAASHAADGMRGPQLLEHLPPEAQTIVLGVCMESARIEPMLV
jgi:hypothetical protein